MKKIIFIIIVIAFLAVGYSLFKNTKVSQSPIETIKEKLSISTSTGQTKNVGGELPFPLIVNGNFNIKLFTKLSSAPRVLAFDQNGVLFASIPSEGKVVALPDKNGDGVADEVKDVVTGLNLPHGIDFDGKFLLIAETNKLVRYTYDSNNLTVSNRSEISSILSGGRHTTRTVKVKNGQIYLSIGSSCDVCIENPPYRADVMAFNQDGSVPYEFAKGLRNTVFFTFDEKGRMWGNDMGRDFLGDNLPPDEINLIEKDKDYGWPFCYGDNVRDTKFMNGTSPDYCQNTTVPKFKYPAHVAPLGITFDKTGDLLASLHGSWNSSVPVGYKVVKIDKNGDTLSNIQDFITGFISGGKVLGRPVDLLFDKNGNLFISDDKADNIYIVSPK